MSNLGDAAASVAAVDSGLSRAVQVCAGLVDACERMRARLGSGGFHRATATLGNATQVVRREVAQRLVAAQRDSGAACELVSSADVPDLDDAEATLVKAAEQLASLLDVVRAVSARLVDAAGMVAGLGSNSAPIMQIVQQLKQTLEAVHFHQSAAIDHVKAALAALDQAKSSGGSGTSTADAAVGWDRSRNPFSPLGGDEAKFDPTHSEEERTRRCQEGVARVAALLGRRPMNWDSAGRVLLDRMPEKARRNYPSGVQYSYEAFPDFSQYAKAIVVLGDGFGPTREKDFARAKEQWEAEHGTPLDVDDHTWHHHEDGRTLMLVPTQVHDAARHTGGWAVTKKLGTQRTNKNA